MRSTTIFAVICAAVAAAEHTEHPSVAAHQPYFPDFSQPWMNPKDDPEARAKTLLAKMNLDDKLNLFHGSCGGYVGNVCGNSRLNIPAIKMNDGPQGFRGKPGTSTAMPSGLTIGASFDVEAAGLWGTTMGEEFFNKGSNVQLGE